MSRRMSVITMSVIDHDSHGFGAIDPSKDLIPAAPRDRYIINPT